MELTSDYVSNISQEGMFHDKRDIVEMQVDQLT